jgi:hypothetical protein
VTCSTFPGTGKDYIECTQDGNFGPFTCGTQDGPLVCLVTPDEDLTIICQNISTTPLYLWADADCDDDISPRDAQAILRDVLEGTPISQTEPCPNVGNPVSVQPDTLY